VDIRSIAGLGPRVSAVTGTTPTTMTSPPPTPALNGTLSGISGLPGMSMTSVQSALRSGQSINGLAAQQGVPQSSLVSFAQKEIQQRRQASGQAPLDQVTLDRLVNRAFAQRRRASAASG
jgi:hypothetical protein